MSMLLTLGGYLCTRKLQDTNTRGAYSKIVMLLTFRLRYSRTREEETSSMDAAMTKIDAVTGFRQAAKQQEPFVAIAF